MIIEGIVNPPSNISFSDGDDVRILAGKTADLLTSGLHGTHYTLTYRGFMFHGYNTTATSIPVSSTTTPTFILWNPKSNDVNCVLVHYCHGYVSGTNTEGHMMFGVLTNTPSEIATGTSIAAFTDGPVINGYLGGGRRSHVKFGVAATITAATQFITLGMTGLNYIASSDIEFTSFYDFNGTIIVPPGVAVFSCRNAASVALFHERLSWYEFPL